MSNVHPDRAYYVNWPPLSDNAMKHLYKKVEEGYMVAVHLHKKGERCNEQCYTASSESEV